jgi:hypothetical protein
MFERKGIFESNFNLKHSRLAKFETFAVLHVERKKEKAENNFSLGMQLTMEIGSVQHGPLLPLSPHGLQLLFSKLLLAQKTQKKLLFA